MVVFRPCGATRGRAAVSSSNAAPTDRDLSRFGTCGGADTTQGWLAWADRSRLAAFRDLTRTLKRNRDGVWACMENKLTDGHMETINDSLQLGKRITRGFRNFHYFRLTAYLKAGGLNIQAPRLLPT